MGHSGQKTFIEFVRSRKLIVPNDVGFFRCVVSFLQHARGIAQRGYRRRLDDLPQRALTVSGVSARLSQQILNLPHWLLRSMSCVTGERNNHRFVAQESTVPHILSEGCGGTKQQAQYK